MPSAAVLESIRQDGDLVALAAPVLDQDGARYRDRGIQRLLYLLGRGVDGAQALPGGFGEAAIGQFLDAVGEPSAQQVRTVARRLLGEERLPALAQRRAVKGGEGPAHPHSIPPQEWHSRT